MNILPYARALMTLSLVAFLGAAMLVLTDAIDVRTQQIAQAASMASFGIGFGMTAATMRTWMWRPSLVVAACQTLLGVGFLLWLLGAFR